MNKLYLSPSTQEGNVDDEGNTEEKVMQKFAIELYNFSSLKNYIRVNKPNYSLRQIVDTSNSFGSKFHLSLHSNANDGNDKQMSTDIYYHSNQGKTLCLYLKNLFKIYLPSRKVNIYHDTRIYKSGFMELRETNAYALLVENYWHDSLADLRYWHLNYGRFQTIYRHFIYRLISGVIKL